MARQTTRRDPTPRGLLVFSIALPIAASIIATLVSLSHDSPESMIIAWMIGATAALLFIAWPSGARVAHDLCTAAARASGQVLLAVPIITLRFGVVLPLRILARRGRSGRPNAIARH